MWIGKDDLRYTSLDLKALSAHILQWLTCFWNKKQVVLDSSSELRCLQKNKKKQKKRHSDQATKEQRHYSTSPTTFGTVQTCHAWTSLEAKPQRLSRSQAREKRIKIINSACWRNQQSGAAVTMWELQHQGASERAKEQTGADMDRRANCPHNSPLEDIF